MTSHRDVLEGHSTGELDSLIRWALRERVVGCAPSPQAWEHIKERLERGAVVWQIWRRCSSFLRVVAAWLTVETGPPLFVVQPARRVDAAMWGYDLARTRLLDQHRMTMRLYSVVPDWSSPPARC